MSKPLSRSFLSVLTLREPWAALVARGVKRFETRGWPPPKALIGQRFAIHAGLARLPHSIGSQEIAAIEAGLALPVARWAELPRGMLVCTAVLEEAYRIGEQSEHPRCLKICETLSGSKIRDVIELATLEAHFGDFSVGRWVWSLRDIRPIDPPIPAMGQRRIWRWSP